MQLLHSSPIPSAEFASLSFLLDPSAASHAASASSGPDAAAPSSGAAPDGTTTGSSGGGGADDAAGPSRPPAALLGTTTLGETLTVVSPLATASAPRAHSGLAELHSYLHAVLAEGGEVRTDADRDKDRRGKRRKKKKSGGKKKDEGDARSPTKKANAGLGCGVGGDGGPGDNNDSAGTLDTVGTASGDEDDELTDDEDDAAAAAAAAVEAEEAARKEQSQAEVLLAMLVAASEESKKKERELEERRAAGLDVEDDYIEGGAALTDDEEDGLDELTRLHLRLRSEVRSQFLRDDASLLLRSNGTASPVQVYHPSQSSGGMGLHYVVLRDPALVRRYSDLLMGGGPWGARAGGAVDSVGGCSVAKAAAPLGSVLRTQNMRGGKGAARGQAAAGIDGDVAKGTANSSGRAVSFGDPNEGFPQPITAAVLTVGIAGSHCTVGTSDLVQTLPSRFADTVSILSSLGGATGLASGTASRVPSAKGDAATTAANVGAEAKKFARSVLSALLLADGDGLVTNAAADAERGVFDDDPFAGGGGGGGGDFNVVHVGGRGRRGGGKSKYPTTTPKGVVRKVGTKFSFSSDRLKRSSAKSSDRKMSSSSDRSVGSSSAIVPGGAVGGANFSPADVTRIVSEQMQILSLAEPDMPIPPYRRRAAFMAEAGPGGRINRRKRFGRSGGSALHLAPIDLAAFDYRAPRPSRSSGGVDAAPAANTVAPSWYGTAGGGISDRSAAAGAAAAASAERAAVAPSGGGGGSSLATGIRPVGGPSAVAGYAAPKLMGPRRDTSGGEGRRKSRVVPGGGLSLAPPSRDGRVGPGRRSLPGGGQQKEKQQQQQFHDGDDASVGSRGSFAMDQPPHSPAFERKKKKKKKRQPAETFDPFAVNDSSEGGGWGDVGAPTATTAAESDGGRQTTGGGGGGDVVDVLDMFGNTTAAAATAEAHPPFQDDAGPVGFFSPGSPQGGHPAGVAAVGRAQRSSQGRGPPRDHQLRVTMESSRASPPAAMMAPSDEREGRGLSAEGAISNLRNALSAQQQQQHDLQQPVVHQPQTADDSVAAPYSVGVSSVGDEQAAVPAAESAAAAVMTSADQPQAQAYPRIQVSIALNEDLTCSYRDSKISSCSVEGVVQIQVKTPDGGSSSVEDGGDTSPPVPPFALIVRDPSGHIKAVQENRKYVDDFALERDMEDDIIDRRFVVGLPKTDAYFPVMRYKCSSELRPVPIRVQTRVRMHGIYCRVALQISSNPANEDDLTDLTIIMAVPGNVRGETLVTSPSGGVWNPSKRSVLWCVAELGEGEKFQLQAQFEMDPKADDVEAAGGGRGQRPSFPVLVRCQCMYAQLSDVELEVGDVPELCPAEVTMKLARRFRLSHRERS